MSVGHIQSHCSGLPLVETGRVYISLTVKSIVDYDMSENQRVKYLNYFKIECEFHIYYNEMQLHGRGRPDVN